MALDLQAVASALADTITAAQISLNGALITATDFWPDAITEPHFAVAEMTFDPHETFGGSQYVTVTCRLFISRGDDAEGQRRAWTAIPLVQTALEDARGAPGELALNGVADDLVLKSVRGPRLYEVGVHSYYGVEFTVFVMGG
jgi:hypothetical protein